MGQTKQVEVVRFIVRDTVEEEIYNTNDAEDKKHVINKKVFEQTDDNINVTDEQLKEIETAAKESEEKKAKKIVVRKKKVEEKKAEVKQQA